VISITMSPIDREIAALVGRLKELPGHLARKHITAAAGRAVRPFKGVMVKNTPPAGLKKGRRKKGEKPKSTGALRRSVKIHTARKKAVGYAVMGYRAGDESRKALWLELGTKRGIRPRGIIKAVMAEVRPKVQKRLPEELRKALENAVKELASGKNPGRGG
jgi:hypothetical protein